MATPDDTKDRLAQVIGTLSILASSTVKPGDVRAIAQAGLDLATLGEAACRKMRGEDPAPDFLAELKALTRAYVRLLEKGHERIVELGGECDPVATMEASDPALRAARGAIAEAERS